MYTLHSFANWVWSRSNISRNIDIFRYANATMSHDWCHSLNSYLPYILYIWIRGKSNINSNSLKYGRHLLCQVLCTKWMENCSGDDIMYISTRSRNVSWKCMTWSTHSFAQCFHNCPLFFNLFSSSFHCFVRNFLLFLLKLSFPVQKLLAENLHGWKAAYSEHSIDSFNFKGGLHVTAVQVIVHTELHAREASSCYDFWKMTSCDFTLFYSFWLK